MLKKSLNLKKKIAHEYLGLLKICVKILGNSEKYQKNFLFYFKKTKDIVIKLKHTKETKWITATLHLTPH
jgi:hypothetical protein